MTEKCTRRLCYQQSPKPNYTKSQLKSGLKSVIASINTQAWKNTALQASKILVHDEIFLLKPVGEEICFPVCGSKHMAE